MILIHLIQDGVIVIVLFIIIGLLYVGMFLIFLGFRIMAFSSYTLHYAIHQLFLTHSSN